VVLGIGLNVSQSAEELPVPTATSLALAGYPRPDRTDVLVRLLGEVHAVVRRWEKAGGDAATAGLLDEYAAVSATLGTRVRAELAGGTDVLEGEAVGLDGSGALVVRSESGEERAVTAGDVWHLR
jgi:BirA family biotin operon repressor/biotin-[acetyl-CoA-carboxylase] ligase